MTLLVSGATADVRQADPSRVGVLFQPFDRNDTSIIDGRVWAADNAAFSGFDAAAFVRMLERLRGLPGCRFVAAPDVVKDAPATLRLFDTWEPMIRALGFPVALVAQDGLTVRDVPWHRVDAVFIGGSTAWKLSAHADEILGYAAALGKHRHVGRVNTRPRVEWFWNLTDTVDGSGFSKWPKRIRLFVTWAEACAHMPPRRCGQPFLEAAS
jgi:hypothetical protein